MTGQVVVVWACVVRGGQWLGERMYGVWRGKFQTRGGPRGTWRKVVQRDSQVRKLHGGCWGLWWMQGVVKDGKW